MGGKNKNKQKNNMNDDDDDEMNKIMNGTDSNIKNK